MKYRYARYLCDPCHIQEFGTTFVDLHTGRDAGPCESCKKPVPCRRCTCKDDLMNRVKEKAARRAHVIVVKSPDEIRDEFRKKGR